MHGTVEHNTHTNMVLQTYQHVDPLSGLKFKGIPKCGCIACPSTETLQKKQIEIAMVTRETKSGFVETRHQRKLLKVTGLLSHD